MLFDGSVSRPFFLREYVRIRRVALRALLAEFSELLFRDRIIHAGAVLLHTLATAEGGRRTVAHCARRSSVVGHGCTRRVGCRVALRIGNTRGQTGRRSYERRQLRVRRRRGEGAHLRRSRCRPIAPSVAAVTTGSAAAGCFGGRCSGVWLGAGLCAGLCERRASDSLRRSFLCLVHMYRFRRQRRSARVAATILLVRKERRRHHKRGRGAGAGGRAPRRQAEGTGRARQSASRAEQSGATRERWMYVFEWRCKLLHTAQHACDSKERRT